MSLFLDIAAGDSIIIGGNATIRLEYKTGSKARLSIDADKDVPIELKSMSRNHHVDRGDKRHATARTQGFKPSPAKVKSGK